MPFPPRTHARVHIPTPLPATADVVMPPQNACPETPTRKEGATVTLQATKAKVEMPTPRFFKGAQQGMAPLLVLYVWGAMSMSTPNVLHPSSGMEERFVCGEMSKVDSFSSMAYQCVSTSRPWQGAQTSPTPHDTYVPGAGSQDTVPGSVLRYRRANLLTPYKPSVWHAQLVRHGLLEKYPNLYHSLMHGFHLGIPSISQSYVPANSSSINKLPAEYEEIVEKEFHKGRLSWSFLASRA